MSDLLDIILTNAADQAEESHLLQEIEGHVGLLRASSGKGNRGLVSQAEQLVRENAADAFVHDSTGSTLTAAGCSWCAGRFETISIRELRDRASARILGAVRGRVRLLVFDGASPVTDIGSLQATNSNSTLFQVASQFNCLESPGPYITRVANYFGDPTQGPRASISAFPATLLRHYAASGPDGDKFIQETDGRQIDLLAEACGLGASRNGYFTGGGGNDPLALAAALETHFEAIRVGVHDDLQVVLGYNWDGAVEDSEHRRIAQVFTSTVAGGGYGGKTKLGEAFDTACRQLLRAAYLGTLLAAAALGRTRVVLTLIGGGVFGNPIPLIWDAIQWALDEVKPYLGQNLDVVVNGYNLSTLIDLDSVILPAVRSQGGVILKFNSKGCAAIRR